jgi:hypothetical protein
VRYERRELRGLNENRRAENGANDERGRRRKSNGSLEGVQDGQILQGFRGFHGAKGSTGPQLLHDNPFVDRQPIAALTEIWDFGLRNPWRYTFDDWRLGGTGALVIADVGQDAHEEINWEPPGAGGRNHGWRLAFLPLTEPIHDYPRTDGMSITGGYVYRGSALDPREVLGNWDKSARSPQMSLENSTCSVIRAAASTRSCPSSPKEPVTPL